MEITIKTDDAIMGNLLKELESMTDEDPEMNHKRGDEILIEALMNCGAAELVEAYRKVKKY